MTIRVSRPKPLLAVSDLDPAKIQYVDEYDLLAQLLSPLVDQDKNGEFVPGVAESITWDKGELRLSIRKNAITASGQAITAEDAAFSLKRMLILARETHAKILGDLLCPHQVLKSIKDDCIGIRTSGSTLILKPAYGKEFLVQILPVADLGIIPQKAVDMKTLAINSFQETSGPYYLDRINPDGSFVLKANVRHWLYKTNMPQTAIYIPRNDFKEGHTPPPFDQFEEDKLDYIPDSASRNRNLFVDFAEHNKEANVSWTGDDSCILLVFTAKGMRDIPEKQRLELAGLIRQAYHRTIANARFHRVPIMQWFSERGEGALSKSQLKEIASAYSATSQLDTRTIKLSTFNVEEVNKALAGLTSQISVTGDLGEYKMHQTEGAGTIRPGDPDMYIQTSSRLWEESINFLAYHFGQHYFSLSPEASEKWLETYIKSSDRAERANLLRDLHFKTLRTGKVVPLIAGPHFDLLRKPWKKSVNLISASSMLWEIERN